MRIIAKSAPVVEHMRDKISKGCDGIEIQLMDDFLYESNDEIQYVENILQVKDIDVKIIHLPILKGEDLNLELFSYPLYRDCFLKAVRLANILGEYFERERPTA